jgi:N-acetylmuramoyl-L-alanine amidase
MTFAGKGRWRAIFICALFSFILAAPFAGIAEENSELREVRFWKNQDQIRFVLDLSKPVEFTNGKLSNPARIFFDLKKTKLAAGLKKRVEVQNEYVKGVRFGQFDLNTVRVVFDLSSESYNFKILNLEDPARLVVDISGSGQKTLNKDAVSPAPAPEPALEPETDIVEPEARKQRFIRKTVVIDPGHGGHDPGAVGPTGLYEKNVVLDIAIRVKKILKKTYPDFAVVLTRETDVFIPLPQRTALSNKLKADLFVSVHANSSSNRKARGMETYLLNATTSDEALRTAARENGVSFKKMKRRQSEMDVILTSLASQNKRDESIKLAGNIQKSLITRVSKRYPQTGNHGAGVKGAPFYVLVGAEMPASLVEVSFISNREEEKLLKTEAYRQMLAQSIVDGIHKYFSTLPIQQIISDDSGPAKPRIRHIKYSGNKSAR